MPNTFLEGLQRPAILQTNSGLPDYSEANDGDVLQIEDGEPAWGAVDALPEIEETDEGKFLAVDQGEAVWADAPSGLPEITDSDEGKVLTVVDNSGTLEAEWATASGGGGNVLNLSSTANNLMLQAIQGALAKILTSQSKTVGMWEYQYVSGHATADDFEQVSTAYADFTEGIPCYATLTGATATINAMARDSDNGLITGSFILPQYSYSSHAFMLNISLGINDWGESEPVAERYPLSIEVFAQLIHIFSQS